MRNWWTDGLLSVLGVLVAGSVVAADLPAGPIADRHELMEAIGGNAKALGGASKAGDAEAATAAAKSMLANAKKIPELFPEGSTHPDSRAKPEIWEDWEAYVAASKALETAAEGVIQAAADGGDLGAATQKVFLSCKGCHDAFRAPEKE